MISKQVIVIGPSCVGKSCIVYQMAWHKFRQEHEPTTEDFIPFTFKVDGVAIELHIYDTAGSEENSALRESKYPFVDAFVAVFSITSKESFDELQLMIERLHDLKGTKKVPMVLVGNKVDLSTERQVQTCEGEELARQLGCPFIEISAKVKDDVEEVFALAVRASGLPERTQRQKCCILL